MADQTTLTQSELDIVARAAILAAATVSISKFSGGSGQDREFDSLLREYETAAQQNPHNPLLQSLTSQSVKNQVADLQKQFHNDPKQSTYEEFKMVALNRCAQAAALLTTKATPADTAQYKAIVLQTCQRVATAIAEHGTMGVGPATLDPKEAAVIDQVKRALGA